MEEFWKQRTEGVMVWECAPFTVKGTKAQWSSMCFACLKSQIQCRVSLSRARKDPLSKI